jgi:hypothetical protein
MCPKLQWCGSSSMLEGEDKSADCAHGSGLSSVPHDEPHSEKNQIADSKGHEKYREHPSQRLGRAIVFHGCAY